MVLRAVAMPGTSVPTMNLPSSTKPLRTLVMYEMIPESLSNPKIVPVKSPDRSRSLRFFSDGTSVLLIHSPAAAAASRMRKRKSTKLESSSNEKIGPVKSPLRITLKAFVILGMNELLTQLNTFSNPLLMASRDAVIHGSAFSAISCAPVTRVALKFPQAPSKVFVDVAASMATSSIPRSRIAWLNSSAVISPFSMASRKLPV